MPETSPLVNARPPRLTKAERFSQISQIVERLGGIATPNRIAREVGISPQYARSLLWDMAESGLVIAQPHAHSGAIRVKWTFERTHHVNR